MPGITPSVWYFLIRPRMYTVSGTLGEVVAFITGYVSGVSKSNPDAPMVGEWYDFIEWLRPQIPPGDADLFTRFAEQYGNDAAALGRLRTYFEAYQSQRSDSSHPA